MQRLIRWRRGLGLTTVLVCAFALWLRLGPIPDGLLDDRAAVSTVVVDRRGVPLYETLSGDGARSVRLEADGLPLVLVHATLAAEDRRFWWHPGVDPIAMARALRTNALERRVAEGGSTISQQVAKLLLSRQAPRRARGWRAKISEAVLAVRLEHRFSKRELLAMYLNLAAYGNQFTGAERASRAYFGVSASMLTPAQAAFLAGLPQRPSGFNPYRHPEAAIARQRVVLRRMVGAGWLPADEAGIAQSERLDFSRAASAFRAPHFVEMVLAAAGDDRPPRIETTLDAALQADVTGIIRSHRTLLRRHGAGNVAVVVLDNQTGEWLAWEGSGDYFDAARGGTINGPVSPRQPGSALKPFTYALAFEAGHAPATVLADIPATFPTAEAGVVYSPRNYDNRYRGPLLARRALAGSENVPAVVLASELGVPNVLRFLQRAGFTTFDRNASHYGLGVTLGNAEVRLDQMTAAFAALARGGEWIQPAFLAVTSRGVQERRRLVTPRTAFWITDILSDPEAREFVFGRGGSLEFPFPVAVKTGTSQAYHDNWTIGYSHHVTVGVWVGNFDRTPLRNSSGVTGAAPIFQAVMVAAERHVNGGQLDLHSRPILPPTSDTVQREICALSGLRAHHWCPTRAREWTAAGEELLSCSWHHLSDEGLLTIYPPQYREWAAKHVPDAERSRSLGDVTGLAGIAKASARSGGPLQIVNPGDGATYSIDPTLRREFQLLSLRVLAQAPGPIQWSVGGRTLGTSGSDEAFDWPLIPGRHRITARDQQGRTAEATIVVR
ncbi:MAG: penicillin-binding protein 1C [Acidobacteria bacterium]|nr:penicillin-binding protein 1C [Acidobacteriota bacterium]